MDGFQQVWQFFDFSSNLTGPDMQNFSLFENHEKGDLEQECFKSTLPMS